MTVSHDLSGYRRLTARPAALAVALIGGLLVAASGALWFHYGTAVFYETILAGLNACF